MYKKLRNIILLVVGALIIINLPWLINHFSLNRGTQRFDINYPEKDLQTEASILLTEKGIRHKIDNEGILRFNSKDKDIVDETYRKIESKYKPDWPNIHWASADKREKLISFLETNKIPYLIRKLDAKGGDYILWPPEYDTEVKNFNKLLYQHIDNIQ